MEDRNDGNSEAHGILPLEPEIAAIVPVFLQTLEAEIVEMRRSMQLVDLEPIRFWGHSLAGSGASYGFPAISQIGRSIERAAMDRNVDDARRYIDELADCLRRAKLGQRY